MQHNSFPNLVPNPHFVSILEIKGLKIRTLYEKKENQWSKPPYEIIASFPHKFKS